GDVDGDEDVLVGEVDDLGDGREHDGHVEGGPDTGVERDIDQVNILTVERIGEPAGDEHSSTGYGEDDVGPVTVVGDGLGELADGATEDLVGEVLAGRGTRRAAHGGARRGDIRHGRLT